MTNPTPPGDFPLYQDLGAEWNDIVSAFPEDRRSELAPLLKSRIDAQIEPLKPWSEFSSQGVTPDHAKTALELQRVIEENPREVYEKIGQYLGITPQQAQQVVKESEAQAEDDDDPRIKTMQQQLDTLAQIALAQRQQESQAQMLAQQEAELEKQLSGLAKKYGDFDEEEVVMRMLHRDMTPEQAYLDYVNKVQEIRRRPIAPMVMGGSGGSIPRPSIDVKGLDNAKTKDLVVQMLQQAQAERNRP